jgi:hypothetical protein
MPCTSHDVCGLNVKDNEYIIYSDLMDGKSWLTINADTIYVVGALAVMEDAMLISHDPAVARSL